MRLNWMRPPSSALAGFLQGRNTTNEKSAHTTRAEPAGHSAQARCLACTELARIEHVAVDLGVLPLVLLALVRQHQHICAATSSQHSAPPPWPRSARMHTRQRVDAQCVVVRPVHGSHQQRQRTKVALLHHLPARRASCSAPRTPRVVPSAAADRLGQLADELVVFAVLGRRNDAVASHLCGTSSAWRGGGAVIPTLWSRSSRKNTNWVAMYKRRQGLDAKMLWQTHAIGASQSRSRSG
jgi:hypothetical protein